MSELLSIAYEVICKILSTAVFLGSGVIMLDIIMSIISKVVARKRDSKQRKKLRHKLMIRKHEQAEGDMYRRLWAAEDKSCENRKYINVYLNGRLADLGATN